MPIATTFNRFDADGSAESILGEWLRDFFASEVITFEQPGPPENPTIWLQKMPSLNREIRERAGGRTVQGKSFRYAVSVLTKDRDVGSRMVGAMQAAVLASASTLGAAGLRYVELMPFSEAIQNTQPRSYRKVSFLSFTVQI